MYDFATFFPRFMKITRLCAMTSELPEAPISHKFQVLRPFLGNTCPLLLSHNQRCHYHLHYFQPKGSTPPGGFPSFFFSLSIALFLFTGPPSPVPSCVHPSSSSDITGCAVSPASIRSLDSWPPFDIPEEPDYILYDLENSQNGEQD
ncbi:hypothetical protein BSKO_05093 [Bryopsis sp. KO-2023]|nr:hypothetical protein BSKO_05093 [Bryopsis sp. KO-2023]